MTNVKRILLVDDDVDLVAANKAVLEAAGFEVHTAHDGESGVAKAKEVLPHLMFLDVMMGRDDEGFDTCREIAKIPELKDLPVVMLTSIVQQKKLPFSFEPDETWLPCKAFLEKPLTPKVLVDEANKWAT